MTALDIIKRFEGCHRKTKDGKYTAYKCPADVWTVGWGSTGPDVTKGTTWTKAECDARLERDAGRFTAGVQRYAPHVSGGRRDALVSFTYNLGLAAYAGSTLRRKVNEGDWPEAARQLRKWNKSGGRVLPGLVLRREVEALLLEGG